ncbi:sulfite exporter TauE/SafE family protein [Brevibacillus sp. SYSU BS000544]|uniref:urease accessory protein UreH domain-containing protein n=1 Tax=Brevibacillus sp. SYSU BS000544 TaxID=3416443 RepID=UPI003CE45E6B
MSEFYALISRLSGEVTGPLMNLFYATEVPILSAILLGMAASLAPCQISANIGSLTYFTHRWAKGKHNGELAAYLFGRILVYTVLGGIVVFLGKQIANELIPMFTWSKKLLAPFFILVGIAMLGVIPSFVTSGLQHPRLTRLAEKLSGSKKAFLLGILFSLGFCPTMFWLFFGLLIPMAQTHAIGVVDPLFFSIGTIVPLLVLFAFLGDAKSSGSMIKKAKTWGKAVQTGLGIMLILIGVVDVLLFW